MTTLTADGIAIDCPDPLALASFYAGLLDVPADGNYVRPPGSDMNIWFQHVANYQPPSWPTQERGQQLHLDFAAHDQEATIQRALALGATLTERRPGFHYPIMLDPVGHPFCLVTPNSAENAVTLAALNFDCDNVPHLVEFYHHLLGGTIEHFPEWSNLHRDGKLLLSFQHAEGYQPPTWPTQERGQQMHIDFHSDNRDESVREAIAVGAQLQVIHTNFSVLLDPAGHPFCICDPGT